MAESPHHDTGTPTNTDMPENSLFQPSELYKQISRFLERFFESTHVPVESKVELSGLTSAIPFQSILDILYIYFCPEGESHPDPPNSSLRAGGTQLGAVVSTLIPYISVAYDAQQLEHVVGRVSKECSEWIRDMACLPDFTGTMFHLDRRCIGGVSKIVQVALHQQYPALYEEGQICLQSNPPIIYISPAAPPELEQQLSLSLSIGCKFIKRLSPVSTACLVIDVTKFEEIIKQDKEEGRRPLFLLAYIGTPETGHSDDFTRISFLCSMENIWLHLCGVSLSNLILSHRQSNELLVETVTRANSVTFDIGLWFGLPTLPNVTLYREGEDVISNRDVIHKLLEIKTQQDHLLPLVVWTTILSIGRKALVNTVDYAMGISTAIVQGLSEIPSIKLFSPDAGSYMIRFGYRGPPFILKGKGKDSTTEEQTQYLPVEMTNDFFNIICESLVPDFPSLQLQEGPDSQEMRYLSIDVYHCFTQLGAGLEEVEKFILKMKRVAEELDISLLARVHLSKQLHREPNLFMKEVKGRPSIACIHYIPTKLVNSPLLRPEQITQLNKANRGLAVHMQSIHPAYGHCEMQDYLYVELRRIRPGEEEALYQSIAELKEQAQKLETETEQLEVLSEQVTAVLSNVQAALVEEQDKAFWEEGIMRKVPLIGSFVNWWSPYAPQATGRSFNFISGKMETTEDVYKSRAQITTDESGLSLADSSRISASNLSLVSKSGAEESPVNEKDES